MRFENKAKVEMVEGVEGMALYVNDHRIAGPKPWGGGRVVRKWSRVTEQDVLDSLPTAKAHLQKVTEERDKLQAMFDALSSKQRAS